MDVFREMVKALCDGRVPNYAHLELADREHPERFNETAERAHMVLQYVQYMVFGQGNGKREDVFIAELDEAVGERSSGRLRVERADPKEIEGCVRDLCLHLALVGRGKRTIFRIGPHATPLLYLAPR